MFGGASLGVGRQLFLELNMGHRCPFTLGGWGTFKSLGPSDEETGEVQPLWEGGGIGRQGCWGAADGFEGA